MSKWISVNEALPDHDGYFLVYRMYGGEGCNGFQEVDQYCRVPEKGKFPYRWFFDCRNAIGNPVTHWRRLPPPPTATGEL